MFQSLELGSDTLLIDEDTCATNFMIRDIKMMQLVTNDKEPITPLIRIAPSLSRENNVSLILVIGGSGDYFDIADRVLLMDSYRCFDVTEKAKQISKNSGTPLTANPVSFGVIKDRYLAQPQRLEPNGKVRSQSRGVVSYGSVELDLRAMEQIISVSQTNTIATALQKLGSSAGGQTLRASLENLGHAFDESGLDILAPGKFHGALTRPRLLEIGGALNRLRREGTMIKQR